MNTFVGYPHAQIGSTMLDWLSPETFIYSFTLYTIRCSGGKYVADECGTVVDGINL